MSNAISALDGANYDGFAQVQEMGVQGMITLRGDLAEAKLRKAAEKATGCKMPEQNRINAKGRSGIAWMSPDELLLLLPYSEVDTHLAAIEKSLTGEPALAVNVSDARALFEVSGGAQVREVIAKLAPVDMSTFAPGMFRRTRMAQVPAALWMPDDSAVRIVCFRSVAQYMFDILKGAAVPGSEVGYL